MGVTGMAQRHENDCAGLLLIERFRWLRSLELGRFLWPGDSYSRTRTDRVLRSWIERELVIARQLPDAAGRAVVLSEAGARFLRHAGLETAKTGKDWGRTRPGQPWLPDLDWRHDLKAAGVLSLLYEQGYDFRTEQEIQRDNPRLSKIPDGLVLATGARYWLEVEGADKRGKALASLAEALCVVSCGSCIPVCGVRPTGAMVALDPDARDYRGDRLDHRATIRSAVAKTAKQDVSITWCICNMTGHGVTSICLEGEVIAASLATRILQVLNSAGWRFDDGCHKAQYGNDTALIWEDDVHGGWGYCLNNDVADVADNKTAAQRACAGLLAAKHQQ